MRPLFKKLIHRKFTFRELILSFLVMLVLGGIFSYVSILMNDSQRRSAMSSQTGVSPSVQSSLFGPPIEYDSMKRVGEFRLDLFDL